MSYNSLCKTAEYFEDRARALVTLTITNALPRSRRNIDCGRKFSANLKMQSHTNEGSKIGRL